MRARLVCAISVAALVASCMTVPAYANSGGSEVAQSAAGSFVTKWDPAIDDAAPSIALPLTDTGTYDFTVNWGDGSTGTVTSADDPDASMSMRRTLPT